MLELIVILAFFLIMTIPGFFTRKKAGDTQNYYVMGHKGSTVNISMSLFATIIGASATLGMAGLGYSRGLTGMWWLLPGTIGLVILGIFIAKRVRDTGCYTLSGIAAKQYGPVVGLAVSFLIPIAWLGVIGGQILAAGKIMSVVGMGSPELWMLITTAAFVLFTVIGGQWAAVRTDVIQTIIIILGIGGGFIFILTKVGGLGALFSQVPSDFMSFPLAENFGYYDLIKLLLLVGLVYVVGPDIYSRLLSAKDGTTAQRSTFWAAALLVPLAFAVVIIGMSAAVLFPGISPEAAFPTVIQQAMPPILGGLVLGSLLCAVTSSSLLLSASTIVTEDIIHHFIPGLQEKQLLFTSRIVVIVMGISSLLVALYLKGIISSLLFAYTIFSSGVIPLIIFGFFHDKLKLTSAGAIAAIIGGGGAGLISQLLKIKYLDIGAICIGIALLLLVSWIGCYFRNKYFDSKSSDLP
ncbi:MAG: sodium:solute symporter family protein [Chloroflexi bacterium]|nr:sodium:solute symporter family protein [Chloroflexota bacterium]